MIVRHDMDLEALGEMAQVPDDVSPLKIGSRGGYAGTRFDVIGRLKVAWEEGYWNEWSLLFEDGRHGWLAEAMGFYMLSFEQKDTAKVPGAANLRVGGKYELVPSQVFFVDDMKDAVCIGSEGELPFQGLMGRKTRSVDLSNNAGEYACIEYSTSEGVRLFTGRYVNFEDLEFSNLRDLTADLKKVRASELFKCPSCGGPVSMLTPGLSAAVVCTYCGSTIDATNKNLQVLSKADKKIKIKPLIPIGAKGSLLGTEWEVIGFMRRTDSTGVYPWDEYLLFNPYRGFRWLTTENGHWNFVEMLRARPVADKAGTDMRFRDRTFKRFLIGKAKVVYVLGEFYWRVKTGETVDVADYVSPPEVLSREGDKSEAIWSLGRYAEPQEIVNAFGIKDAAPQKAGVAPNQPSPHGRKAPQILRAFTVLALCLTILQIYFIASAFDREIFRQDFIFNPAETSRLFATPSFDIPGSSNNLEVALHSPVQNDWMEAGVDLINDKTQQGLGFEQGVEYYYGRDSDGPWTEGSQFNSVVLSSIPGGSYHIAVQPIAAANPAGEKRFTLFVRRGVSVWSNYFFTLVLLSVYPLFVWWRSYAFEVARWSTSDFSPYKTDDE